jgi:hypothetical protein
MTPYELACELGISPKTLRAWLRRTYGKNHVKNSRWFIDDVVAAEARLHWS